MINLAFTGGSTGGHVFPIRSLIQYIKTHDKINAKFDTIYWFGENHSMEQRICSQLSQEYNNIQFATVIAGKVRREYDIIALAKTARDMLRFIWGIITMVVRFPSYHVDIVFCKGGFVSLPLTIAAYIWRVPIMVHESDTSAGLATRICGRLATHNFSAFSGTLPNSQVVGQIMSNDLAVTQAYQYGESSKTNLLLMGGSLGAMKIYQAILELQKLNQYEPSALSLKPLASYNIIIILGALNADMKPQYQGRAHVIDRADQTTMGQLYAWADICICRGGTTSLAEMELFGIRKIIVPLPITHDQVNNAQYYVDHHGDTMVTQDTQLSQNLNDQLESHIGYHKATVDRTGLSKKLNHATDTITQTILQVINHQSPGI